jgi:hypothetical protein
MTAHAADLMQTANLNVEIALLMSLLLAVR